MFVLHIGLKKPQYLYECELNVVKGWLFGYCCYECSDKNVSRM